MTTTIPMMQRLIPVTMIMLMMVMTTITKSLNTGMTKDMTISLSLILPTIIKKEKIKKNMVAIRIMTI